MSSGAIVNLTANHGAADAFLYARPERSWFAAAFRRCTNFAVSPVPVPLNTQLGMHAVLELNNGMGDLLGEMYLRASFRPLRSKEVTFRHASLTGDQHRGIVRWVRGVGHALVEEASVSFNGMVADRQDRHYLHLEDELFGSSEKTLEELAGYRDTNLCAWEDASKAEGAVFYCPLRFWFCANGPAAYLPLLSMQFTEVTLNLHTASVNDLIDRVPMGVYNNTSDGNDPLNGTMVYAEPESTDLLRSLELYANAVFLDEEERRLLATRPRQELLMTQVQRLQQHHLYRNTTGGISLQTDLTFTNPVRFLACFLQERASADSKEYFNYSGATETTQAVVVGTESFSREFPATEMAVDPVRSLQLVVNGHRRFKQPLDALYLRQLMPRERFARIPRNWIYAYSFALRPASLEPSGSMNFTRLDSAILETEVADRPQTGGFTLNVYAQTYNVLVIAGGVAGVKFA